MKSSTRTQAMRALLGILSAVPAAAMAQEQGAGAKGGGELEEITVSAERVSVATKANTPIIETPQSISVIGADRLLEQGAQSLQDAVRYVAGARSDPYGIDPRGDFITIRGGTVQQYQDGLQMPAGASNNVKPEPFAMESISVLKGPSSVLYGQGPTGGVVNLVSKRPQVEARREIGVQMGNYSRKQAQIDFTGPIDAEGRFSYRLVGLKRDSGMQVKHVPDDRDLLAPSLLWRPTENTSLTLLLNYQRDDLGSNNGFFPIVGMLEPAPNGRISPHVFISEPGFDKFRAEQRAVGYQLEHRFNDVFTVRQNARSMDSSALWNTMYTAFLPAPNFNPDGRTLTRELYISDQRLHAFLIDNHLSAQWGPDGARNLTMLGIDYQKNRVDGRMGFAYAPAIDAYEPVYGNYTVPPTFRLNQTRNKQLGFYLQEQLKLRDRFVLLAGLRRDSVKTEVEARPEPTIDEDVITKRVGVLYLAPGGLAPYANYAESFSPIAGVNFFGEPYKPIRAEQVEVGIKYQPAGNRMLLTLAAYDITEQNRRTSDPSNPNNLLQVGEAELKGIELEGIASLTERVKLIASYAITKTEVTRSNTAELGKRLATVPEKVGGVWATYDFSLGALAGFKVGAGARYIGKSWDGMDEHPVPDVTLFDAMLGYDAGAWDVSINAKNLSNKTYLVTCLARGDCGFGAKRSVIASANYRF